MCVMRVCLCLVEVFIHLILTMRCYPHAMPFYCSFCFHSCSLSNGRFAGVCGRETAWISVVVVVVVVDTGGTREGEEVLGVLYKEEIYSSFLPTYPSLLPYCIISLKS